MQLVLERCTIRPWRLDDAESLAKHANNRKSLAGGTRSLPASVHNQDAHEFLQRVISDRAGNECFVSRLTARPSAGLVFTRARRASAYSRQLGYWLGEEFWGRGIMTEAVAAVTDFCFDNFPLRRIYCRAVCEQSRIRARAGKSRFHFRRTPQEQRDEGWTSFSIHCSTPGRSSAVRAGDLRVC